MDQTSPDYLQMLAQALQDPDAFKSQFGDAFKSFDGEDEATKQRMALAQHLMGQTENTGATGPGATGQSALFGGLARGLQNLRGEFMMRDAQQEMKDAAPKREAAAMAGQRLKLAMEAYKNNNDRDMQKLKNEPDMSRNAEEQRYHDAYLALERDKMGADRDSKKAKADADKADQTVKVETDLRNKLLDYPETKNALQSVSFFKQITGAPKNGAGDLSRIYGLAKLWDPGGRVTDSDAKNAAETGGLPGQLQAYFNKWKAEGSLGDVARAGMDAEAHRLLKDRLATIQPMRESFRGLATQYGANPDRVDIGLGFEDLLKAAPAAPSGPVQIKGDADYNALPSGAEYIAPDGQHKRKR